MLCRGRPGGFDHPYRFLARSVFPELRRTAPSLAIASPASGTDQCAAHDSALPRHEMPELLRNRRPSKTEGAGNAGCWPHPQPRGQKRVEGPQAKSLQVKPKHPALPARWLYGLLRALPGVSGLLAPVAAQIALRKLDPSVEVTGPHGLTVRLGSDRLAATASIASHTTNRDDRVSPLMRAGWLL